jgi:hypothetical protein
MGQVLQLFMWGYQTHFRIELENTAKETLAAIGFDAPLHALLVGVRHPDSVESNPVCIEPEFKAWPLSLFDGINDAIEDGLFEARGPWDILWRSTHNG